MHTHVHTQAVNASELASLDEDLDSASANIEYVQENIVEIQNNLIAVDDSKSDGDTVEAHAIITASSPRESKYLLEHLLDMVLDQVSDTILHMLHCHHIHTKDILHGSLVSVKAYAS